MCVGINLLILWVALHDIIKGNEDLIQEYIAILVISILLPVLIYFLIREYKAEKKYIN